MKTIPKTLDDAMMALNSMLSEKEEEFIMSNDESAMIQYHHTIGRTIRNKWGFWTKSELKTWFNDKGIVHPDDMSGILMKSFWRFKHDKPLKLNEQIQYYKDYWRNK